MDIDEIRFFVCKRIHRVLGFKCYVLGPLEHLDSDT